MKRQGTKRKRSSGALKYRTPYGRPEYKKSRYAMYRWPKTGWPNEYTTDLVYVVTFSMNAAGTANANTQFSSNAFDVDPTVGGHAMPGFTPYAVLYSRFRTLKMAYEVEFANNEAFNLVALSGFSNSAAAVIDLENTGNALWKSKMMGPLTGINRCQMKDSRTIVEISGTKQALYDDVFTGSTTSSTLPAAGTATVYFGIQTPTGVLVSGCSVRAKITLTVQFYKRNTIDV